MAEAYHTDQKQPQKGPFKSINLQKRFQSEYGTDNEVERIAVSNLSAASIKNPQALRQNDYEGKPPLPHRPSGGAIIDPEAALKALEEQANQFDIVEPKPHVTMRNRKSSKAESGHDTETWREKIKEEKEEDDGYN